MANITTYQPRLSVPDAPRNANAKPLDATARAVEGLGGAIARMGKAIGRARADGGRYRAKAEAVGKVKALEQQAFEQGGGGDPPAGRAPEEAFDAGAAGIRDLIRDDAGADFDDWFGPLADVSRLTVRRRALADEVAGLRGSLPGFVATAARAAGTADDADGRAVALTVAATAIDDVLAGGYITAAEAAGYHQRLADDSAVATVTDLIARQPEAAVGFIAAGGLGHLEIPAGRHKALTAAAHAVRDDAAQTAIAAANRARDAEELAEARAARDTASAGDRLILAEGRVPDGWLAGNAGRLAPDDLDAFGRIGVAVGHDPATAAELRSRTLAGEDVGGEARRALADGRLSIEGFAAVHRDAAAKPWQRQALQQVAALAPAWRPETGAERADRMAGLDELHDLLAARPDEPDRGLKAAQAVAARVRQARRARLEPVEGLRPAGPADLATAVASLAARFAAGTLTTLEAARAAEQLALWQETFDA